MRVFRTWAILVACTLTLASCAADGPVGAFRKQWPPGIRHRRAPFRYDDHSG